MFVPPTLAYIDPMSGAIVLQLILAGIIGAIAFFRGSILAVIRTLLRIKPKGGEAPPNPPDAPNSSDSAEPNDS